MQETLFRSLIWEDPTCHREAHASKLLSLCSRAQESQLLSQQATTTEVHVPKTCGLQQERPLQWEVHALQLPSSSYSPQLEKSPCAATKTQHSQKQIKHFKIITITYCWTIDAFKQLMVLKTLESPFDSKEIKPVNPIVHQSWMFLGRAYPEAPILWPPDAKNWFIGKHPDAGKDRRPERGWLPGSSPSWSRVFEGETA